MYDLTTMSCAYVLAGHTEIVLCLDTCVTTSGRTLIVTGSKDNSVSLYHVTSAFQAPLYCYYHPLSSFCCSLCGNIFIYLSSSFCKPYSIVFIG